MLYNKFMLVMWGAVGRPCYGKVRIFFTILNILFITAFNYILPIIGNF